MNASYLKLLAVCLLFPIFLADAAGSEGREKQTHEISLSPSYGDALIQHFVADPDSLNPLLTQDSETFDEVLPLIFDSLTHVNADLTLSPRLADSWETSADNLMITYHLKKGIRWHDGENFSAEDVLFTFEKILDPESGSPIRQAFLIVDTIEVVDTYEVRIHMKTPTLDIPLKINSMIIPKHAFDRVKFSASESNRHPIGTGPFKFLELQPGGQITLVANQDYHEGRPFLDRVVFKIIPDDSAAFLSLMRGELDLMKLSPDQYTKQANSKEFRDKFNVYSFSTYTYWHVAYNLNHPILKDKNTRQALTISINRQSLIDNVRYGFGNLITTDFLPSHWACDKSIVPFHYDPELSRKLLSAAGWKDVDGDGIRERDGMKLTLEILIWPGNPTVKLLADTISDYWKAVGISTQVRMLAWTDFLEQLNRHNFQTTLGGWGQGNLGDLLYTPFELWHSSQIPNESNGFSGDNYISYHNPEVDRLCEAGRSTFDREKLKEIYYKIQALIHEDQPYTFLYTSADIYALSKRFHGIDPAPAGIFYNFPQWYVPEGMQKYK
ncbi:MAG: peptide-binding protein [Candidatus Wallbacteria bacterium]|nr:peptide-binding protein [Candidatus Wallbacteria bacterium]